jgi:hypothetical protein
MEAIEMHTKFWPENLNERGRFRYINVNAGTILTRISGKNQYPAFL